MFIWHLSPQNHSERISALFFSFRLFLLLLLFNFFAIFVTVMSFIELIMIAVGLSMDAFAVAIGKGLSVERVRPHQALVTGVWFGGFQALMPVIGFFLGISFASFVQSVDHWVAFILLGVIGFNMIHESFSKECEKSSADFSARAMFPLAVATSIDALAVGISFAFLNEAILPAATTIGITTLIFSAVGIYIGNAFGCRYKSKAEFLGGAVLIMMGVKILIEHLA